MKTFYCKHIIESTVTNFLDKRKGLFNNVATIAIVPLCAKCCVVCTLQNTKGKLGSPSISFTMFILRVIFLWGILNSIKLGICQLLCAGQHKVRGPADGVLRPKLFCEAEIDEIYDLINIGPFGEFKAGLRR